MSRRSPMDTGQYPPVPPAGKVYLDEGENGQMVLTHLYTLERKRMPPGQWELVFSEDGQDAVATKAGDEEQDDEVIDVASILQKTLLRAASGAEAIETRLAEGASSTLDLDVERSRHRPASSFCL